MSITTLSYIQAVPLYALVTGSFISVTAYLQLQCDEAEEARVAHICQWIARYNRTVLTLLFDAIPSAFWVANVDEMYRYAFVLLDALAARFLLMRRADGLLPELVRLVCQQIYAADVRPRLDPPEIRAYVTHHHSEEWRQMSAARQAKQFIRF